jgi:effector-binding domain-containing protein
MNTIVIKFEENMLKHSDCNLQKYHDDMVPGFRFIITDDDAGYEEFLRVDKSLEFQFLQAQGISKRNGYGYMMFKENKNFTFLVGNSYKITYEVRTGWNTSVYFHITDSENLGLILTEREHGKLVEIK